MLFIMSKWEMCLATWAAIMLLVPKPKKEGEPRQRKNKLSSIYQALVTGIEGGGGEESPG